MSIIIIIIRKIIRKEAEKTRKYGPLRYELKQQFKGYKVEQFNIIMDVLGGYSAHLEENVNRLVGKKSKEGLRNMQKSVISWTLNITRTLQHSCSLLSQVMMLARDVWRHCNYLKLVRHLIFHFLLLF